MLRSRILLIGLTAGLAAGFIGCGDDGETADGGPGNSALPPGPGGNKPADGPDVAFGISKLFLGDTDPDGRPNVGSAWKQYGFNLDGQVTTGDFSNHCTTVSNIDPKLVLTDGANGIDNAFGQTILPIILPFAMDASDQLNSGIREGTFSIIFEMRGLGSDAEYNPLPSVLFAGADGPNPASFDGNDEWFVVPELLDDPADQTSSKIRFPNAYLIDNTWVSGPDTVTINLSLNVAGFSLNLPISNALVAMDLSADHAEATNGVIAGVLPTDQLVDELKKIAGSISTDLCEGTTFDSIANQLRQASDIMADGTQDPNSECNGISIGLGFSTSQVKIVGVSDPAGAPADPCNPGTGGAGGMGAGGAGGAG